MSDTPTPSQAAEKAIWEALEAGPTPGMWSLWGASDPSQVICCKDGFIAQTVGANDEANGAFIAACSPANLTALLDAFTAKDAQLAEMRAEVERLRKNDARYRWLRQPGSTIYVDWIDFDGTPEQLDIAVDAALAADGKDGAR